MIIVVTHGGKTTEHSLVMLDVDLDDAYLRSLSEEMRELPRGTLQYFVVDRVTGPGPEPRIYVRPKMPFGSVERVTAQLEIAVEALLQYSSSPSSGQRARQALTEIAALDEDAS